MFEDETVPTGKFKDRLELLQDEEKNGLFILEYARYYFRGIAALADEFDIHIVVTYRRLYEWLPSAWSENMKHFDLANDHDTGKGVPLPFDFREEYYGPQYVHPAQQVITAAERNIGKGRFTLSILDLHAKYDGVVGKSNNLLAEVLCSGAVPDIYYACNAAKKNELLRTVKEVNTNKRLEIHYQTLAFQAYKLRLTKTVPTIETEFKLKKCLSGDQAALDNLPKVCMSEKHTGMLYNLSWEQELKLFPERDERSHRLGFEEYYRDRKVYCSIDVDKWLLSKEWRKKIISCMRADYYGNKEDE